MADLIEIQGQLARVLDGAGASELSLPLFVGDEDDVARRLAVYRGNLLAASGHALAAAYPVIVQVVGAEFFEALARAYQAHSPSTSGDLNQYGMQLPAFLEGFPHVRELPYLPDLARLEWAVHSAHYAADTDPLDVSRLASVPEAEQASLRLRLNPLCALFESRYPLARIWEIHQKDYAGEFSVQFHDGPFRTLVSRPRFRAQASRDRCRRVRIPRSDSGRRHPERSARRCAAQRSRVCARCRPSRVDRSARRCRLSLSHGAEVQGHLRRNFDGRRPKDRWANALSAWSSRPSDIFRSACLPCGSDRKPLMPSQRWPPPTDARACGRTLFLPRERATVESAG